jgi:hypothetical protein
MRDVAVHPLHAAPGDLLQVLREAGFAATAGPAALRLVLDGDFAPEDLRDSVLGGAGALVASRAAPVLKAFGLHCPDGALSGLAEPVAGDGLPPVELAAAWPVSGAGYALYRLGGACVVLEAPRGRGRVVLAGSTDPRLLLACLLRMSR